MQVDLKLCCQNTMHTETEGRDAAKTSSLWYGVINVGAGCLGLCSPVQLYLLCF